MSTNQPMITLSLSNSQALVLFEWLAKQDETDSLIYEHHAEERVIWKIQGQLESVLVEPFWEDYVEILKRARVEVTKMSEL